MAYLHDVNMCYVPARGGQLGNVSMRLKIKEIRAEKGISQTELASHLGLSTGYMSQIENNRRRMTLDLQEKIANYLGVEPGSVVDFTGATEEDINTVMRAFDEGTPEQRRMILSLARSILSE